MDTLNKILAIVGQLAAIGLPPGPGDAEAFRTWLRNFVNILAALTEFTSVPQDDAAVRLIKAIVESDEAWEAFYALVFAGSQEPPLTMGSGPVAKLESATAIDPVTIIALINMILELIKAWRNRK